MSSFTEPHHLYLFSMKNGKKKLAYGPNPEAAYEYLHLRLTSKEMEGIDRAGYIRIPQRELQKYAKELG